MLASINNLFQSQLGMDFEDEFMNILKDEVDIRKSTKYQDEKEGTDFFFEGIRVDVTFFYSGKTHCKKIGTYKGWTVGIRVGNGHVRFEEPVLVLGQDCEPSYVRQVLIPRLRSELGNVQELADAISDYYWTYIDAQ